MLSLFEILTRIFKDQDEDSKDEQGFELSV